MRFLSTDKYLFVTAAFFGALSSISIQVVSLFALTINEYAVFSFLYLIFALCFSSGLSLIIDPAHNTNSLTPAGFQTLTFVYTTMCGVLIFLIALPISNNFQASAISALCVSASLFRFFTRMKQIENAEFVRAILLDLIQLISLFIIIFGFSEYQDESNLTNILIGWAFSSLIASIGSLKFPIFDFDNAKKWARESRSKIRGLWLESALLDASSVGIPIFFLPVMGITGFGIYRAVSSTTFLPRVFLGPLRPHFGQISLIKLRSISSLAKYLMLSGIFAFSVLLALSNFSLVLGQNVGVLTQLSEYAVQAALLTFAVSLSTIYYSNARVHFKIKHLLNRRIVEIVLSISFPIIGFFLGGTTLAIWGLVATGFGSAIVWIYPNKIITDSGEMEY